MKKMAKNLIPAIEYSIQNPKISMTKVGEIFGVNRRSLSKYKKNNLYLQYKYYNQSNPEDEFVYSFEQEELNQVQYYLNNPTMSYNEILKLFPGFITRETMYHYLDILGYEKTEGQRIKYHYDRNKFKTIEAEEDAYWLGFITADGCLVEGKWLAIQLQASDKKHLKKFCYYMGLDEKETNEIILSSYGGAYTKDNPVNSVKICSLEILNNLYDKGLTPRKSGKEKPFICSTPELEKAYIRGLIDGDGFIGSTQKRFGLVGSYEICEYVKNYIIKYIRDISQHNIYEHGTIYKLELTGAIQSSQILTYFYKDANVYLDRKYELFLKNYNNSSVLP